MDLKIVVSLYSIHAKAISVLLVFWRECNFRMLSIRAPSSASIFFGLGLLCCNTESYMLRYRTYPFLFVHNEEYKAESDQVGNKLLIALSSTAVFLFFVTVVYIIEFMLF